MSRGHSIKSLQVLSPAGAEEETSNYKIIVVSPVCILMISGTLISPTEQNFQLLLQSVPVKVAQLLKIPQQDFTKSPNNARSFPSRVYFSKNGNPSINTLTPTRYEDLHSSFPTAVMDLFSPVQQQSSRTTNMFIHCIHTS